MRGLVKKEWYNSLHFIIAIACIVLAILPMVYTGVSMYQKFSHTLIESSRIAHEQIMDQLKINIEEYLEQGIKATSDIHHMINQNDNFINNTLKSDFAMLFSTNNDIVSISIFDLQGDLLFNVPGHTMKGTYDVRNEEWYENIAQRNTMYQISQPHVQQIFAEQYPWVISVATPITIERFGEMIPAILTVDISLSTLHQLCSNLNLGGRGYVYLREAGGDIIYHPQQAVIASGIKEEFPITDETSKNWTIQSNKIGEEYLVIHKTLSFVDWNIVGVSYLEDVAMRKTKVSRDVFMTIPVILLVIVWLSWFISGKISLPIMKLQRYMHKVEEGDFNIQIHIPNGEREVRQLAATFNKMVRRIKELLDENHREQEAKRQTELEALQSQINPHFLYNTLDSIMWMAEGDESEEVVELVTSLARFFRISISKGASIITVEEELEHARSYLLIQKIRYKDKFDFTIEVEPEVLHLKTIKLILQPLIENAIYHGIEYMVDEGCICIKAYRQEDNLIFEVKDDGLGMEEDQLHNLRMGNHMASKSKGSGVGMQNVRERIRLRFGEEYGFEIDSELEEGTSIRLVLPIIGGEEFAN